MPRSVRSERALKLLRKLEWSGVRHGMGNGPHGSGPGGRACRACPICKGVHREDGATEFNSSALGHKKDCELLVVLHGGI